MFRLSLAAAVFLLAAAAGAQETFEQVSARARAALKAERVEEAARLFAQATKLRPDWAEGWWRLGTLHFDGGRAAEARDAFQRFLTVEKQAGPGFAMIGLCEYQLKRYSEALPALEKGLQLGVGPNHEFARIVLLRNAVLHSLMGRSEVALKRLTLLLNQAAAARPGATPGSLLGDTEAVDAIGVAALRMRTLEVPAEKAALVRLAGRAQALVALEDRVAAAREFQRLAASYPREPGVHYRYGVFLSKEDPPGALAEFLKELEVSPKDVDARVQCALEYMKAGDAATGRKHAAEAVDLAPGNFAARVVLARLWLELDRVDQALEQAQAAVRLAPQSPDARFTLSQCYARANRPEDASRERAEFQRLQEASER